MNTTMLRIPIDPLTLEALQATADTTRRDLEMVAAERLKFGARLPQGRSVVIGGDQLEALEGILGGGSILNAQDLLAKVQRLAGISFLHLRLPFTPNQLEALAEKAARNSLTMDQLVERTAPRIYEQFFDLVART